ncbi:MAG: hypothetical protein Q8S55_13000 [Methylococcaceae bacterium]|nr:hypothetical protein [Methylococcaceae bacterium]
MATKTLLAIGTTIAKGSVSAAFNLIVMALYAEYDVVKQHPGKAKWFVESVTAWGNGENIKAEPKLLPMPS